MKTNHKVIKNIKRKNNKNRNNKGISLYETLKNFGSTQSALKRKPPLFIFE